MSPRYLRYRFPSAHAADAAGLPVASARALAERFLAVPPHQLTVGALEGIACTWAHQNDDPGALGYTQGEPMGESLGPWLQLVIGPGGRLAYLDVDLEEMGRAQARAMRTYLKAIRGNG